MTDQHPNAVGKTDAEIYRDTIYMATLAHNHDGFGWPVAMMHNPRYAGTITRMVREGHITLESDGYYLTAQGRAYWRRYILARGLESSQRSGAYNRAVRDYDEDGMEVEAE